MTSLAPTEPLTRDQIKEALDLIARIEANLEAVPHGLAKAIIRDLSDLHDLVGEGLPGGYVDDCMHCDTPLGDEDNVRPVGDGDVACADCAARWAESINELEETDQ